MRKAIAMLVGTATTTETVTTATTTAATTAAARTAAATTTTAAPAAPAREENDVKRILSAGATLAATLVIVPAVPARAAPAGQAIRVTGREYSISLSARPKAGAVTLVIRNLGDDAHDVWVRGGGRTFKSRALGESGTARVTATLEQGVRHRCWCGVSDHAEEEAAASHLSRDAASGTLPACDDGGACGRVGGRSCSSTTKERLDEPQALRRLVAEAGSDVQGRALDCACVGEAWAVAADEDVAIAVEWGVRGGEVWLAVLDRGPGVGADDPELFERFARGAAAAAVPGTGLGLAIVRTVARRWGGDARVESRPGGGTRAELSLPLAVAAPRTEVTVA